VSNLKNYTSVVPATNSIQAIEKLLVEAGALSISKWYEDKKIKGFLFQMLLNGQRPIFRLPANEEQVYKIMLSQHPRPSVVNKPKLWAQAQRTAWRTLHEWVQIQVDMIRLEQVEPLQVWLAYNYDEASGRTLYDEVQSGSIKLLT
jgi:hypothetical protein